MEQQKVSKNIKLKILSLDGKNDTVINFLEIIKFLNKYNIKNIFVSKGIDPGYGEYAMKLQEDVLKTNELYISYDEFANKIIFENNYFYNIEIEAIMEEKLYFGLFDSTYCYIETSNTNLIKEFVDYLLNKDIFKFSVERE